MNVAINDTSNSSAHGSNEISPSVIIAKPLSPLFFTGSSSTIDAISLSWISSGGTTAGFQVSYALGSSSPLNCDSGTVVPSTSITGSTLDLTGLLPGTTYSFALCSLNSSSPPIKSDSVFTHVKTLQLAPSNVINLSATPITSTEILLKWVPVGSFSKRYIISYQANTAPADCSSGTVLGPFQTLGTERVVSGLIASTTYGFRVCAQNSNPIPDTATGTTTSAITFAPPPPNPSLGTPAITSSSITLNWTSGGGSTDSYRLAYWPGGSAPANCHSGMTLTTNSLSLLVNGLDSGRPYGFRLCALDASGSPSSGVTTIQTTIAGAPSPITMVAPVLPFDGIPFFSLKSDWTGDYLQFHVAWSGQKTIGFKYQINSGSLAPSSCNGSSHLGGAIPWGNGPHYSFNVPNSLNNYKSGQDYTISLCAVDLLGNDSPIFSQTFTMPAADPFNGPTTGQIYITEEGYTYVANKPQNRNYLFLSEIGTDACSPLSWSGSILQQTSTTISAQMNMGWTPNIAHQFRFCLATEKQVGMIDSIGHQVTVTPAADILTPPNEATNLQATPNANGALITWSKGGTNVIDEFYLSVIEGDSAPGNCSSHISVIGTSKQLNLAPNRNYSIRLCSLNWDSPVAVSSGATLTFNSGNTTPVPMDVQSLNVYRITSEAVQLKLEMTNTENVSVRVAKLAGTTPPSDCSQGIFYNFNFAGEGTNFSTQSKTNYATLVGLTSNTTYSIRVCSSKAVVSPSGAGEVTNWIFSSTSLTSTFTTGVGTLSTPQNIIAETLSDSEVRVQWDPVVGATSYVIAKDPSDCSDNTNDVKVTTENEIIINHLEPGEGHIFKVCSRDGTHLSEAGTANTVITDIGPGLKYVSTHNLPTASYTTWFNSIAIVQDLNADGVSDIVSSYYDGDGGSNHKHYLRTFVNLNGPTINPLNLQISSSAESYDQMIDFGDYNLDGISDVLVSKTANSKVFIFSGSDGAVLGEIKGPDRGLFGETLLRINDVNSDGYSDFIVSAPEEYISASSTGKIYVYSGKDANRLYTIQGTQARERFGSVVVSIHDINNDLIDDLVISSPYFDSAGKKDTGKYAYFSGADGSVILTIEGDTEGAICGKRMFNLKDTNLDSFDDLAISCPNFSSDTLDFIGKIEIVSTQTNQILRDIKGQNTNDLLSGLVYATPDLTQDGVDDLVFSEGNGWYLFNPRNGNKIRFIEFPYRNIVRGGDVNGDGKEDLILINNTQFIVASPR